MQCESAALIAAVLCKGEDQRSEECEEISSSPGRIKENMHSPVLMKSAPVPSGRQERLYSRKKSDTGMERMTEVMRKGFGRPSEDGKRGHGSV